MLANVFNSIYYRLPIKVDFTKAFNMKAFYNIFKVIFKYFCQIRFCCNYVSVLRTNNIDSEFLHTSKGFSPLLFMMLVWTADEWWNLSPQTRGKIQFYLLILLPQAIFILSLNLARIFPEPCNEDVSWSLTECVSQIRTRNLLNSS